MARLRGGHLKVHADSACKAEVSYLRATRWPKTHLQHIESCFLEIRWQRAERGSWGMRGFHRRTGAGMITWAGDIGVEMERSLALRSISEMTAGFG